MINIKDSDQKQLDPPGTFVEILPHPFDKVNKSVEKAVIIEHRFAFFYWMKWYQDLMDKKKIDKPPLLVSIDWHTDLTTSEGEQQELNKIDNYSLADLALFCWEKLSPMNDGQILAAAYLNVIGDIVLLKREYSIDGLDGKPFKDKNGNPHNIFEFNDVKDFEKHLIKREENSVFFDIDLDYFITSEGNFSERDSWIMMKKRKIKKIINVKRRYMKWILKRLEGYTIATEPEYCGGILQSSKILTIIEEQFFNKNGEWKI